MTKNNLPRVTFGIILLNGEPFIRYNLRAIYPFASQIIVVEGAAPGAAKIATSDGHSLDGSLETLYRFQAEEDPESKIEIVRRDGFWSEKDEMSQAYAERATGDYLWQVDIDEFYQPEDMRKVMAMLSDQPRISAVFFKQITFWGGFDYVADGWYLRQAQNEGPGIVTRLFRWGPDYRYVSHRPVIVRNEQGQDVRQINPLNGRDLARQGIFMYHYSLVFPRQVAEKSIYYGQASWARRGKSEKWATEVFTKLVRPFRVHNVYKYPSWLERFEGRHPPQIEALRADITSGRTPVTIRQTDDIEYLLASPVYRLGRKTLKLATPAALAAIRLQRRLRQ